MAKLNKLFLSRNFLDCVVPKIQAVTVLRQSAPSARCHWHSRSHLIGWKLWSLVSRKLRTLEKISKGHFCSASNHLSVLHISHRFCNIIYKFIVCQLKEKKLFTISNTRKTLDEIFVRNNLQRVFLIVRSNDVYSSIDRSNRYLEVYYREINFLESSRTKLNKY